MILVLEDGKANLEEIEAYALKAQEPKTSSGKQDGEELNELLLDFISYHIVLE